MEQFRTFEDLECWKACRDLRLFVAKQIASTLPKDEKYRLTDQMLRAARSTTANIAEGYGRFHYLDTAKFCSNARGSVYEVLDHLITARDESLINGELFSTGGKLTEKAVKLLNGYIHYLQQTSRAAIAREPSPEYGGDERDKKDYWRLVSLEREELYGESVRNYQMKQMKPMQPIPSSHENAAVL